MTFGSRRKEIEKHRAGCICAICRQKYTPEELDVHSRSGKHLSDKDDAVVLCGHGVGTGDSCHELLHAIEDVVPRADWARVARQVEGLTQRVINGEMDIPDAREILRRRR